MQQDLDMSMSASLRPTLGEISSASVPAEGRTVIPIIKKIPIGAHSVSTSFRKIRAKAENQKLSFLLEISTAEDPTKTHFSIIGIDPFFSQKTGPGEKLRGDPLRHLEPLVTSFHVPSEFRLKNVPSILNGGAFGYISYDCVRYYEYKVDAHAQPDNLNLPESVFMLCGSFVCFDHLEQTISFVALCLANKDESTLAASYAAAAARVAELELFLSDESNADFLPVALTSSAATPASKSVPAGEAGYKGMVRNLKQHIVDGDIIQCVPSHRVTRDASSFHSFEIYMSLRTLNPSRYMFYVELESFYIVGSSPELLVKVQDGLVETHPIAGTRPRGQTPQKDQDLEIELLADEKERAEHIMLVDLGRNDVNRVAAPQTTTVNSLMHIERYSHVMRMALSHIIPSPRSLANFLSRRYCFSSHWEPSRRVLLI